MKPNRFQYAPCLVLIASLLFFSPERGISGTLPKKGSTLPDFRVTAPDEKKDSDYLNLGAEKTFRIQDIDAKLLFIEIIGVYCLQCHKQLPSNRKLFFRIKKNSRLAQKVRMIAIAAGANTNETKHIVDQLEIPYPVLPDTKFQIHKILGEPRTPFTMLVTPDGKVKYAHVGLIKNMNRLYKKILKEASKP